LTAAAAASTAPPTLPQPVVAPTALVVPTMPIVVVPATVGTMTAQTPVVAAPAPYRSATRRPISYVPPSRSWWQRRSGGGKVAIVASLIAVVAISGTYLASGGSGDSSGVTARASSNVGVVSSVGSQSTAAITVPVRTVMAAPPSAT